MDFIISSSASDILGGTSEPTLYPRMNDIMNWRTLMSQLLSCNDKVKKSQTENLLERVGELSKQVRTKESSAQDGTHSWMSVLLKGRLPVTSLTPTQLPLLLQLYTNEKKSGDLPSLITFGTERWTNF